MKNRSLVTVVIVLAFAAQASQAFAQRRDDRDMHGRVTHHDVVVVTPSHENFIRGGIDFRYHAGRFYRRNVFGLFVGAPAPLGVVVTALPFGYKTVVVAGTPYYYYNNVYYAACPSGYVVVPAPSANPAAGAATVVINVPNSDGSFTPVTLVRSRGGYIGPQGEFYAGSPTVEQLKALYGR